MRARSVMRSACATLLVVGCGGEVRGSRETSGAGAAGDTLSSGSGASGNTTDVAVGVGGSGASGSASGGASSGTGGGFGDKLDPNEVYIAGTLSEGACYMDALAHWSDPNTASVGFDCYFQGETAQVRADGRLVYQNLSDGQLRVFTCDECPWRDGRYPEDPQANDEILDTPPCPGDTSGFQLSPEGEMLHQCYGELGTWRDATGAAVLELEPEEYIMQLGYAGLVLTTARVVDLSSGIGSAHVGLPELGYATPARATPSGFLVVPEVGSGDALWEVEANGSGAQVATYPTLPSGYVALWGAQLDTNGVLFQFAYSTDPDDSFNDAIVRRVPDGDAELVYQESSNPVVKVHISDLVTGP